MLKSAYTAKLTKSKRTERERACRGQPSYTSTGLNERKGNTKTHCLCSMCFGPDLGKLAKPSYQTVLERVLEIRNQSSPVLPPPLARNLPPLVTPPPPPPGDCHFNVLRVNIYYGGLCCPSVTHGLAMVSHYFKSSTCVCSVIFSLQRRCVDCCFFRPNMFSPGGCVWYYSHTRRLSKVLQNAAPKDCGYRNHSANSGSQRRKRPRWMMQSGLLTTKPCLISVPLSLLHCTWSLVPSVVIFGLLVVLILACGGIGVSFTGLSCTKLLRNRLLKLLKQALNQLRNQPHAPMPPHHQPVPHTQCLSCKLNMCNSSKCAILVPGSSLAFLWIPIFIGTASMTLALHECKSRITLFCLLASVEGTTLCLEIPLQSTPTPGDRHLVTTFPTPRETVACLLGDLKGGGGGDCPTAQRGRRHDAHIG